MRDFDFEVMQRKRLASQASHRKCGSKSKKCSLSTDHMTKKQWKERCGEMATYQMGKPMSWEDFKCLPVHIQKEYLMDLIHKYSTTASDLARMFGIAPQTVTKFCRSQDIGIMFMHGKRMSKEERAEFEKFLSSSQGTLSPFVSEPVQEPVEQLMTPAAMTSGMNMTQFSLSFEGVIIPEMITNSIIAMLRPNSNVKLEVMCSVIA